jgi:nucleotidyltransferase/DNA polymerase involved in DNA repair
MPQEFSDRANLHRLPMLTGLVNALRGHGLQARGAIADTWGSAHAIARATRREVIIVPVGETAKAVVNLPISSLRLSPDIVSGLAVLGFRTVGEVSVTPRAPLVLRFGPEVGRRLDQDVVRSTYVSGESRVSPNDRNWKRKEIKLVSVAVDKSHPFKRVDFGIAPRSRRPG